MVTSLSWKARISCVSPGSCTAPWRAGALARGKGGWYVLALWQLAAAGWASTVSELRAGCELPLAGARDQRSRAADYPGMQRWLGEATLYVAPTGADRNAGTWTAPFKTIAAAAAVARPGTTVCVAPGDYEGGFRTNASGAAGAPIYYVSSRRWAARIVPPTISRSDTAWDNRGSFIHIVGFHIDGSAAQGGVPWTHGIYNGGSYAVVRNNWVHHIAMAARCTTAGGSAIGVDSYYRGVQADVLANLVHDIGPPGCRYIHGIYVSTTGTVKNNVVYRVAGAAIHLWHDAHDVIVTNNTVSNAQSGIIVGAGDYYLGRRPNDHTIVASNIVVCNQMGISEQGNTGSGNRYSHNLVYANTDYDYRLKNGLEPLASINAAPDFLGEDACAVSDFRLRSNSAAIGAGSAWFAHPSDFDGKRRDAATGYDIGAYQH